MRAWIEMVFASGDDLCMFVALFMRAWIEICNVPLLTDTQEVVALFMRAWIEIHQSNNKAVSKHGRPLHEGVD